MLKTSIAAKYKSLKKYLHFFISIYALTLLIFPLLFILTDLTCTSGIGIYF